MKAKIMKYIKDHAHSGVHDVANNIGANELETLSAINQLCRDGYVKQDHPILLSENNHNSVYYSATGKFFIEE